MKLHKVMQATRIVFCAWFLVTVAHAQTFSKQLAFRVRIPFEFIAGEDHMPAGHYSVYRAVAAPVAILENDDHTAMTSIQVTESAGRILPEQSSLVFNRYGKKFFLETIVDGNEHLVQRCAQCREEMYMAGTQHSEVILALK